MTMFHRTLVRLVSLGICLILVSSARGAEWEMTGTHHDWESLYVVSEGLLTARARTAYEDSTEHIALIMDRLPPVCGTVFVGLAIFLPKPLEIDFRSEIMFGEMQIDDGLTHKINFVVDGLTGEDYVIVSFTSFAKSLFVLEEIKSGHNLSFKLALLEKNINVTFSLNGSRAALERSLQLCTRLCEEVYSEEYLDKREEEECRETGEYYL